MKHFIIAASLGCDMSLATLQNLYKHGRVKKEDLAAAYRAHHAAVEATKSSQREEAKGADLRALIVDGQVVGAMKRQGKEGEFRSNLHRGGTANIIQLSDDEENAALKAAKALGLAVCGVDMLQSSRGPLILEVNSSPGLEDIEAATKKDIAKSIIRYIERNV